MKKVFGCLMVTTVSVLCLAGCTGSSTSGGYSGSGGYSNAYYSDSDYRQTVDDISDMTGDSHYEVDRKIDAMTRAINGD